MPLLLVQAIDTRLCQQLSAHYLSDQEQRYLSTLRHSARISDYVTSRLASKLLLFQWLQHDCIAVTDLELYGPPSCPPKLYLCKRDLSNLNVSVSHSRGLVLVGITEQSAFGLDIEHVLGHDWPAIFAYMRWPMPTPIHQVSIEGLCCCVWTIYEAGFKLFGGLVAQSDFRLLSITFPADQPLMNRGIFSFKGAFADLRFAGEGIVEDAWIISVAMQPLS